MTRTNYPKPSNLLLLLKLTGKSYWDMIGYPLPEVVVTAKYPHEQRVIDTMNNSSPEFLERLRNNDRRSIHNPDGTSSTHVLGSADNIVFPEIMDVNGKLIDNRSMPWQSAMRYAIKNNDYIEFPTEGDIYFQGAFKDGKDMIYNYLPGFKGGFDSFANNIGQKVYIELKKNGWYTPLRYDNIMSLLSHESAYGTSNLARNYHNYGGRVARKGLKSYKGFGVWANDDDFVKDQIQYIKNRPEMWNAKDTLSYAKAGKKYKYFKADVNDYASLMRKQISARKAWNAAMNTWSYPKLIINTAITEPVDATSVALPVLKVVNTQLHLPTPVASPEVQPTTYIDPSIFMEYPEEILQPVVEDDYEASLLPSIQDAMLYFLPSLAPFANNDFMSLLVLIGLPGAKYGKDSGIHIKPSHRGRFTRYLKSHPGMTAEKAKHSKSAAVRKMATFALNARKWNH